MQRPAAAWASACLLHDGMQHATWHLPLMQAVDPGAAGLLCHPLLGQQQSAGLAAVWLLWVLSPLLYLPCPPRAAERAVGLGWRASMEHHMPPSVLL